MALAYNINFNGYICSLIDAKNDNVYFGLFDNSTNNHMKENDYLAENINYMYLGPTFHAFLLETVAYFIKICYNLP